MMPSTKFFIGAMVVLCILFLIGAWTLHRDEERAARIVCVVVAVICAGAAIGALLGPFWHV